MLPNFNCLNPSTEEREGGIGINMMGESPINSHGYGHMWSRVTTAASMQTDNCGQTPTSRYQDSHVRGPMTPREPAQVHVSRQAPIAIMLGTCILGGVIEAKRSDALGFLPFLFRTFPTLAMLFPLVLTALTACLAYPRTDVQNVAMAFSLSLAFVKDSTPPVLAMKGDLIKRQASQDRQLTTSSPASTTTTGLSTPLTTPLHQRAPRQRCENPRCTQQKASRHAKCDGAFCKACCQTIPGAPYCHAPRHNDPPTLVLNSFTTVSLPPPTPLQASTSLSSLYRFSPPLESEAPPSSSHPSTQIKIPFSYEKPMGRHVDLAYVHKIHNGHHDVSSVDKFRRESYRKSESSSLKIRLWVEDGKPSVSLVVSNPAAPWFHPKDCEPITKCIAPATCTSFEYWAPGEWVLTDLAIKVKPATEILYLRLEGVSDCLEGPRPKRRLSNTSFHIGTPSPVRACPSRTVNGNLEDKDKDDIEIDSPHTTSSISPAQPQLPSSHPSPSPSSTSQSLRSGSPLVGCKFPLEFACDMDAWFKAMSRSSKKTIPERFLEAFGVKWVRSTYYTHYNVWATMDTMDNRTLEYAVQCAHGAGGNWQDLVALYGTEKGKGKAIAINSQRHVSERGAANIPSLQLENLKHILRLHRDVPKLKPTAHSYLEAAQWLVDEPNLIINWTHVFYGSGSGTMVDKKMHEFYTRKLLDLPGDIDAKDMTPPSSPLTSSSTGNEDIDMSPDRLRQPTPLPEARFNRWIGTDDQLKEQDTIFWKFASYDPEADVKFYDPKVIIVHQPDPQQNIVQRWNSLDLTHLYHYTGVLKVYAEPSEMDMDLDNRDRDMIYPGVADLVDLDPNYLITVSLDTRELIETVIYRSRRFHTSVFAGWVGHPDAPLIGPLCTYDPDAGPAYEWNNDFPADHVLPATGAPNALRVALAIKRRVPLGQVKEEEEETEGQRINRLIVAYLLQVHGENATIKEIRRVNGDPKEKTKGRTPYAWTQWVTAIQAMRAKESKFPRVVDNDAAGKVIFKTHLSAVLGNKSQWIASCLSSAEIIDKCRATSPEMRAYLRKATGSAIGVDKFLKQLRELETQIAQAAAGTGGDE
ncbi:hypothetical protein K438DRAFT_2139046 [Mycena galopus ATCC 62051]|nr:hypothetical protein K438DRAFT_2139046 [Mycena galopus ATCC 62051]